MIRNPKEHTANEYFSFSQETLNGDFIFGQKQAQKVTWFWKINGTDLNSCDNVTFYNGDYVMEAYGKAAGHNYTNSSTFSITVQCQYSLIIILDLYHKSVFFSPAIFS